MEITDEYKMFIVKTLTKESSYYNSIVEDENDENAKFNFLYSIFSEFELELLFKYYKNEHEREYDFSLYELLTLIYIFDILTCNAIYEIMVFINTIENNNNKDIIHEYRFLFNHLKWYKRLIKNKEVFLTEKGMYFPLLWLLKNNLFNKTGINFIFVSSKCQNIKVIELLFDYNILIVDDIELLLRYRYNDEKLDIIEYLYSLNNNINFDQILYMSCRHGNFILLKWIFNNISNLNIDKGFKAACLNGNVELINFVISNDKNNVINNDLKTIGFYYACDNGNLDAMKMLYNDSILNNFSDKNEVYSSLLTNNHYEAAIWFKDKFNISNLDHNHEINYQY